MIQKILYITAALMPFALFASEGSAHVPHASDLVAPAFNFLVLAGFLIWKLKKPMSDSFIAKEKNIRETLESVANEKKRLELQLNDYKNKLNNLENEVEVLKGKIDLQVVELKQKTDRETEAAIMALKRDAELLKENERREALQKISSDVIDLVLVSSKYKIKESSNLDKFEKKILQGMN